MRVAGAQIQRFARALVARAAVFWLTLALLGPGMVSDRTWLSLQALLAITLVAIQPAPAAARVVSARTWVALAFYSAFSPPALQVRTLHWTRCTAHTAQGPTWQHSGVAWSCGSFLFPGVFSLALGALAASWSASHPQ